MLTWMKDEARTICAFPGVINEVETNYTIIRFGNTYVANRIRYDLSKGEMVDHPVGKDRSLLVVKLLCEKDYRAVKERSKS